MNPTLRSALVLVVALLGVATPRLASACAVCLGGVGGGTARAFALGSLFLSVLPLTAFFALLWYVRRRVKAIERNASERRAPVRDIAA